ncbi:MAG TPA: glycine cleavage T C-terminal barrel domain-containing protein, partial [Stellaceae bacterium]|nr:glycine cleavage T C-terminal barrel domain-containing protein [Stellaceae bacterium]
GAPSVDLWDLDIRRFAGFHANRRFLAERTVETLGLHYAMRWPRLELVSARKLRRSPLYERLAAKGARFGSKMGWERPNYFAPASAGELPYGFAKPAWLPYCLDEQRAARDGVALFDQTSFAKLLLQGRDACAVLQRLCANDMDVAPGRMVYTAMLNTRGGYETDLTAMRLADDQFLIVTGTAQATRDRDWIKRHIGDDFATITDVTSAWAVISVMGPQAEALLRKVSPDDIAGFAPGDAHEIDLGLARVRAARMSYIGGPGIELYIPSECAAHVYDTLAEAGAELGARDAGYYAIDALRIEADRRAFAAELGPDETPLDAGLLYTVKFEKGNFIGRDALLKQREAGPRKYLARLALDDPDAFPWGGEPVLRDGMPVGEVTSAGYSGKLGRAVVMAYVRGAAPVTREHVLAGTYEIDIAGERFRATVQSKPVFS